MGVRRKIAVCDSWNIYELINWGEMESYDW